MAKNVQVKKSNRVITVPEDQVKGYLQRGYDQVEDGKVVKHATGGKNISAAQHQKALDRIKELEAANGGNQDERIAELEAEVEELKDKAKKFAEKGKALQEENEKLKKQNK